MGTGGNITLTADDLILTGNLSGTGTLTLQPYSTSRTMNVATGVADGTNWNLSTAEIADLANGWSIINIGRTDSAVASILGTSTWTNPVTFRSSNNISIGTGVTVTTMNSAPITFQTGWDDLYGTINAAGSVTFTTTDMGRGLVAYGGSIITANQNIS